MITVKRAISDTMRRHDVEQVTIIEGTTVHFSGPFNKLFADCDPLMIVHRDNLLRREASDKTLHNHRHLFVFLKEE